MRSPMSQCEDKKCFVHDTEVADPFPILKLWTFMAGLSQSHVYLIKAAGYEWSDAIS